MKLRDLQSDLPNKSRRNATGHEIKVVANQTNPSNHFNSFL